MSSSKTRPPSLSLLRTGEGWGTGAATCRLSRRLLILAPLALAACGFAPVNAPGGAVSRLYQRVWVANPSDKYGFDLVERMEERLGRPEAPAYDLNYTITTEAIGVGFTASSEITRYNLAGAIDFTLTDRATGARLVEGRVESFTAYSATGSTVAGLAAEEDAAFRLMRILADQIVARLIAVSADLP
ncbi:MAG TPA: LPS assembly lipoprotein LptE [Tabrizicola sp.]|nr:LPS assembly lipoprotein LptE [Tabrizicola sp.]